MIAASATLWRYVARRYLANVAGGTVLLLAVIYIFDIVELLRRAAKTEGVSFTDILGLAAFKLPEVGQAMLPFAILFAAIYTCWRLNRTNEIVVMRSAGLSAWQFLAPMVVTAAMLGVLATTAINPVSAMLLGRYEQREAAVLKTETNQITLSRTGIWLRQPADKGGYALIHADSFDEAAWQLGAVTVFAFDSDDQFLERIDSPSAHLRDGYWELRDAQVHRRGSGDTPGGTTRFAVKNLATGLTPHKIEETFSAPEAVSFWEIPEYVNIMEETGFPATRLSIHFQSLLAKPLFFAALILLAATFSLRPARFGGVGLLIGLGVLSGFFIFFLESMLHAFGISQKIPVYMAAWTPALITLLIGTAALLHTEDG